MPPYDPSKDPSLPGGSKPPAKQPTAADALAELDKRVAKAKKSSNAATVEAAGQAGEQSLFAPNPLGFLTIVPAVAATALTTGSPDYLVGTRGDAASAKPLSEISILDRLIGPHQLSLADPLKAALTSTKQQQQYIAGTEGTGLNVLNKGLEVLGLAGDIALDPLNLAKGAGLAADALDGIDQIGAHLTLPAERLTQRAAIDGADSFAAKGASVVDKFNQASAAVTRGLADGSLDEVGAQAAHQSAVDAFKTEFGTLNGQALTAGENVLSKARYPVADVIHEAPTSAKGRAQTVLDRLNAQNADLALAHGVSPVEASNLRLGILGDRTASDVVRDVYTRGYPALDASTKEALGVTGRLKLLNPTDISHGKIFNPFAHSASAVYDVAERSGIETPGSIIRKAAIGEIDKPGAKLLGLLQPGWGRSGQIWKAALEGTLPTETGTLRNEAVSRLERAIGVEKGGLGKAKIEQWAAYPLTLLNAARTEGITRAAGKALATGAQRAEHEASVILDNQIRNDPAHWTLAGVEGDIVPTVNWTDLKQKALESLDGAGGDAGKGVIRERLAEALSTSLKAARTPVDLMDLQVGGDASAVALKAFEPVVNDPAFGEAIHQIATEFAARMDRNGLDEGDLVRSALNALTTAASISKETSGTFSWVAALDRPTAARELFSPRGAAAVGREAKMLSTMEDLGLAVVNSNPEKALSTDGIHQIVNSEADRFIFGASESGISLDQLVETRRSLIDGLRQRGVTEDALATINSRLDGEALNAKGWQDLLAEASTKTQAAGEVVVDATERLKAARATVADIEATSNRLERVQLAILNYEHLQPEIARRTDLLDAAAAQVQMTTVSADGAIQRLHQLTDADFGSVFPTSEVPGTGGRGTQGRSLLDLALGENARASRAGGKWQNFNRFVGFARDLFGDNLELEQLARHAPSTEPLTRGFGQTEGAINQATVARFFEENAHPDMTAYADSVGGWLALVKRGDSAELDHLAQIGARVSAGADELATLGVPHEAVAKFTLGTIADAIDAVRPYLDDVLTYMETGTGGERLAAGFTGELGPDTLANLRNGDLSFLDTLVNGSLRSIDIAMGTSGAFSDYSRLEMVRRVVRSDPKIYASFRSLLDTLESLDSSSTMLSLLSDVQDTHELALGQLEELVRNAGNLVEMDRRARPLMDKLAGAEHGAANVSLTLSEADAASARQILTEAKANLTQARRQVDATAGRTAALMDSASEATKRLYLQEAIVDDLTEAVGNRSATQMAAALHLQRQVDAMYETPMIATILGGSADFKVIQRGLDAFVADPKVAFYEAADGTLKRRTPERVYEMWQTRLEGAAGWVDTMRDRAVNGWTTGGENPRVIAPVSEYSETNRIQQAWLEEQAHAGFSVPYHGAALADEGAASAFIAVATHDTPVSSSQYTAAFDYITQMLKAQYVGTGGFSTRNMTGGSIENLRQGVSPRVSAKVFGADSTARELERLTAYANTLEGAERDKILGLVERTQAQAEKFYGPDVFGATIEARQMGVTESILFKEISGSSVETTGFRGRVGQAWQGGRFANEARFGDSPFFGRLAAVTGAIGEIPSIPARWYERKLAGGIERLARGGDWSKIITSTEDRALWRSAMEASEQFGSHPGVEALLRVDLFAQRRLAGDTVERAFDRVMEAHFDYSDLSNADNVMRRVMPFWIWRSRSIAHYGEMILHHPAMAATTFGLWNDQHRGTDLRAPLSYQSAGTGFDPNLQVGLQVADPAGDLLDLVNRATGGNTPDTLLEDAFSNANTALTAPVELMTGSTTQGVPLDTPTSIQGPMNAIADSGSGGKALVNAFGHQKNGKWYWDSPKAAYAFGEVMPLTANVSKITTPLADGDQFTQKILGTMARFFGAPIRVVSAAEQQRAQTSAVISAKFAAADARRNAG